MGVVVVVVPGAVLRIAAVVVVAVVHGGVLRIVAAVATGLRVRP